MGFFSFFRHYKGKKRKEKEEEKTLQTSFGILLVRPRGKEKGSSLFFFLNLNI
jgi:hypothetical protein